MIKTVVLLPIDVTWSTETARAERDKVGLMLVKLFGGFTYEGTVEGSWRPPGEGNTTVSDTSHRYTVTLSSWMDLRMWLDFVQQMRYRLRQEAIYIEVAGIPEIIS